MELETEQLKKFKFAYLALAALIGVLGVVVAFLTGDRNIGLVLIAVAALALLGGSIMYARLYRDQQLRGREK
ncbi:MAG TPA: hypothetical protein VLT35_00435 [Methanocella sp.]|nr:hypothetical protein [Methanocella sp.]